jgi:hypothetical protein
MSDCDSEVQMRRLAEQGQSIMDGIKARGGDISFDASRRSKAKPCGRYCGLGDLSHASASNV